MKNCELNCLGRGMLVILLTLGVVGILAIFLYSEDKYFDVSGLSVVSKKSWTFRPLRDDTRKGLFFLERRYLFGNRIIRFFTATNCTIGQRYVHMFKTMESALANNAIPEDMKALVRSRLQQLMMEGDQKGLLEFQAAMLSDKPFQSFLECKNEICRGEDAPTDTSVKDVTSELADLVKKWRETMETDKDLLSEDPTAAAAERNSAANELFSLPELPDGVVGDLARMFASTGEDEVWRDYCLQFLGSALERTDGVTDEDRALARETLVEALASTNATFAGTALRALHRGDPSDPLVASNALRIARDPTYSPSSRTAALLILEDCVRSTSSTSSTSLTPSTLAETASAISADPSASSLLRQTAEAILGRNAH